MGAIVTGTVKGYEVKKNRDSNQNVLMLKCAIDSDTDIQDVQFFSPPGDQTIPPMESQVTILSAGKSWKIAIATNDGLAFDNSLDYGDKLLYSKDKASFIKLLSDGTISLEGLNSLATLLVGSNGILTLNGGTTDNAVGGVKLDTALQAMVTLINVELGKIATAINAIVPGSYTPTNIVLNISAAQSTTIKIP